MSDTKYALADLKAMQSWSFERKIQVAQTRIMEWYYYWSGSVAVSFSGGKDSTVLLNLARRCFPEIEAVYVDTGLEYPEVRQFALSHQNVTVLRPEMRFDEVVKKYGWCYPSKDVAKTIYYARRGSQWAIDRMKGVNKDGSPSKFRETHYKKWAYLLDSDIILSDICCAIMKEKPLYNHVKQSGKQPLIGTLAVESRRRTESWLKHGCNAFEKTHPSSQPLSFFTEQDILRYLRDFNIPYASVYGEIVESKNGKFRTTGERRTGCVFCPVGCHLDKVNRFQRLAETHAQLQDYVINTLGLKGLLDFVGIEYNARSEPPMKTIAQIAEEIGVSKQAVYKRYKGKLYSKLNSHAQIKNGVTYITEHGEKIIKDDFSNGATSYNPLSNGVHGVHIDYIKNLQEQNVVLQEQNNELREENRKLVAKVLEQSEQILSFISSFRFRTTQKEENFDE